MSPKTKYKWISKANVVRGLLIYASGDSIAALIQGDFTLHRFFGMMIIGATIYALEIPNYFKWIDTRVPDHHGIKNTLKRTTLAMAYFNPLWITRHLLFIKIISLEWNTISWHLLVLGLWSFILNIPISLLANYLIQNKIHLSWRFFASAVFSALMAIYYALAEVIFN
jgi:hypothetical protein